MKPTHMHTYRKIALLLMVVASFMGSHAQTYTPSAHVQVNDAVAPAQATPLEARSMFFDGSNFLYRAFQSTSEVLSYLNTTASRTGNFIIIVDSGGTLQGNGTYLNPHNTYYMFADSTTAGQLKKMNLFGSGSGTCAGCLLITNNLSDLASVSQALINLNLNNVNNTSDATKNAAAVSLTNHTIDGTLNTLLNIPNSALLHNTIGLTINSNSASDISVTTTPAALGASIVANIPTAGTASRGALASGDWNFFDGKLDSVHVSNDSIYNCVNGVCTLQSVIAGGGAVNSVTGTNTTLLFSPSTGNVLGQVNQNFAYNWSNQNTFTGFAPIFSTLTTPGGLFYGNSSGQLLQSGGGTSGQILQSTGGGTAPIFFLPDAATVEGWLGFTPLTAALPSTNIFVGNGSNVATARAMSGDGTLSNTGVLTINKGLDSAIWKSNATYTGNHTLTMNHFTQTFSGGTIQSDTQHIGPVVFNNPAAKKIVFLGTSITFGTNSAGNTDTANDFATVATAELHPFQQYIQVNLGVTGNTVDEMVVRVPVWDTTYAFLNIEAGTNEILDVIDTATFRANYTILLDTAIARGWTVDKIAITSQMGNQIGYINTPLLLENNYVDSTLAKSFGTWYTDAWNPELQPGMAYIAADSNTHPNIAQSLVLGHIVAGSISRQLQYDNIHQRLVVKAIAQIGDQYYKNMQYIANPGRLLTTDSNGRMGATNALPASIRTQQEFIVGGSLMLFGANFTQANTYIPPSFDTTKDFLLGPGVVIHQPSAVVIGTENTLVVSDVDGGAQWTVNRPGQALVLTAPQIFQVTTGGIDNTGYATFHTGINVLNTQIDAGFFGETNTLVLSDGLTTRNVVFYNRDTVGQFQWRTGNGSLGGENPDMSLTNDGSLVVELGTPGNNPHEDPSSKFTVNSGVNDNKGSQPVPRLSTAAIASIVSPRKGLQVYDTTLMQNVVSDGTSWSPLGAGVLAHSIFAPTTGGTVNLVNRQYNVINPGGALLAVTLNLPSSPANNDVVYIKFTQSITTVTYANGTVVDGITAPTAGGLVVLTFDAGTSSWY